MGPLLHSTSMFAAMAVSALVSAAWEGAVLAGCVYLCLRLFPRLSAAARSVVWLNVFVLLVLLHVAPAMGGRSTGGNAASPAPFEVGLGWSFAIAGVWAALSLLRAVDLMWSAIRSSRLARRAHVVDAGDALRWLLEVRTAGGRVIRTAELCISAEVERPSVFGFFHPRILLPGALRERLTAEELEQVVVHEMEHLRRGDDWTNLLQKAALVVFPLNPALLWVERRLCAERELACDDSVLRSSRGRKAYAICLTRLAEFAMVRRSMSLVLGAWERQSELVRRVHRILRRPVASMSGRRSMALTAGLMTAVVAGGVGLARSPRLVSFVPHPQATAQAQLSPDVELRGVRREQGGMQAGMKAEMVKAVMPRASMQGTMQAPMQASAAPQPMRANAVLHSRHRPAVQAQTWLLLTEWSDADVAPRVVFAVQRTTRVRPAQPSDRSFDQKLDQRPGDQPQYAAVPFANGWLIVQI